MAVERDRNLAQLVSMGYQPHEASLALEESKNSLEGAIDRLAAHQFGRSLGIPPRRGGHSDNNRGGRARGRKGGRGFDPDIEEDPLFDPVISVFL